MSDQISTFTRGTSSGGRCSVNEFSSPTIGRIAIELDTPQGLARVHLHQADGAHGALVLGHGAGGSITAPDLVAVTTAATQRGVTVALVEQPYRVAGRTSAPPAPRLDEAWLSVLEQLCSGPLESTTLVTGGRSSGARVACRTATATGAAGVVCLAFPLCPPQRSSEAGRKTRLPELDAAGVPVLIVQGENDRFGMPPAAEGRDVVVVPGDHGLKRDVGAVADAVTTWLPSVLG